MISQPMAQTKHGRLSFSNSAPVIFVLLWSTGFIGAKYGLPFVEPFTLLLIRFSIAAVLLFGLALIVRASWPKTLRETLHIAVAGVLLHAGYTGGVFFAISRGMPAGIASLIVGLQPIVTAIFAGLLLGERVRLRQWFGLLLGFGGVALVVGAKLLDAGALSHPLNAVTVIAAVVALLSTTFGTMYQRRFCTGMDLTSGTTIQYVASSVVLLGAAHSFETMQVHWSTTLVFVLAWLVLVLSLGAIAILLYLLRQHAASRLSSMFYLVPPLTAIEAYLLFGEQIGLVALAGIALVALGVALVVIERDRVKR